ncbi:MAG: folate-binding protein, partial [Methylobacteriaceae bacterium]|nr:folate-binding protein [Methylobacteriaceae bacterium]
MPVLHLADRSVVGVAGDEAHGFLERLVTCDLDRVAPGRPRYGALLTPQGKIITDFLLFARKDGDYLLDTPKACAAELVKRLSLYRLRAKIAIADLSAEWAALAGWGDAPAPDEIAAADPRLADLGWRALVPVG